MVSNLMKPAAGDTRAERLKFMYLHLEEEGVDTRPAEYHFARFMQALGHDPALSDHLHDTPARVADMYAELLSGGEPYWFTSFPNEGSDGMVLVADIPFTSFCAHHFLPFTGVAHVAYVPGENVAGLSKLARVTQTCAAKPHVQENLTQEILGKMDAALSPKGVAVMIRARHSCMELRGPRAVGAMTTTTAFSGVFADPTSTERAEFMQACHAPR